MHFAVIPDTRSISTVFLSKQSLYKYILLHTYVQKQSKVCQKTHNNSLLDTDMFKNFNKATISADVFCISSSYFTICSCPLNVSHLLLKLNQLSISSNKNGFHSVKIQIKMSSHIIHYNRNTEIKITSKLYFIDEI